MLQNIITILGNDVLKCYTIYTLCRMNFIPAQWNARCFCKQVGILAVRVGKTEFHFKAHFSLKRRNFEVIFTYRLLSLFSEQIKILIWKFLNSDRRRHIENDSSEILRREIKLSRWESSESEVLIGGQIRKRYIFRRSNWNLEKSLQKVTIQKSSGSIFQLVIDLVYLLGNISNCKQILMEKI